MGTTKLGLVKPGGGEGESLVGIWERGEKEIALYIKYASFLDLFQYSFKLGNSEVKVKVVLPVVKSLHSPFQ